MSRPSWGRVRLPPQPKRAADLSWFSSAHSECLTCGRARYILLAGDRDLPRTGCPTALWPPGRRVDSCTFQSKSARKCRSLLSQRRGEVPDNPWLQAQGSLGLFEEQEIFGRSMEASAKQDRLLTSDVVGRFHSCTQCRMLCRQ